MEKYLASRVSSWLSYQVTRVDHDLGQALVDRDELTLPECYYERAADRVAQ